MEFHTAAVVPTTPDAMDCCDSETLVAAKRLATRYEGSAPMTPMTMCVSDYEMDVGKYSLPGRTWPNMLDREVVGLLEMLQWHNMTMRLQLIYSPAPNATKTKQQNSS